MMPGRVLRLTMIVMIAAVLNGCGTVASTMITMQEMGKIQTKLSDAGFENNSVGTSVQMANGVTMHGLKAIVDRPPNPPIDQKIGTQVAEIVIGSYSRVNEIDYVTVELRGPGNPETMTLPPDVWRELVRDFSEPPGIKSAVLARGVRQDDFLGMQPVEPTSDFPVDQGIFHAIIMVKNLPPDTMVRTVWTAVDTHGAAPPNLKIRETHGNSTGTAWIYATMGKEGATWPEGSYKLDVIWDDTIQATVPFTVSGS